MQITTGIAITSQGPLADASLQERPPRPMRQLIGGHHSATPTGCPALINPALIDGYAGIMGSRVLSSVLRETSGSSVPATPSSVKSNRSAYSKTGTPKSFGMEQSGLYVRSLSPKTDVVKKRCLLLNLDKPLPGDLNNEASREMIGLSSTLKMKKESKRYLCEEVFLEDAREFIGDQKYDQISIVCHSRYYSTLGRPLSVSERFLGHFTAPDAIAELVEIVYLTKAKSVKFYGCETACYQRETNAEPQRSSGLPKNQTLRFFSQTRYSILKSREASIESMYKLSTVEYFSYKFLEKIAPLYDGREITVSGLNGVGYIPSATTKNPRPQVRSFDAQYYGRLVIIKKNLFGKGTERERNIEQRREEAFTEFERECVDNYPAPYKLKYRVSIY